MNLVENDLTKVELGVYPLNLSSGLVTLTVAGSSRIKLWEPNGAEKKGSILSTFSWSLDNAQRPPLVLWLEGIGASGEEWDVRLKLKLEHGGNLIHQEEVKFTVFDVEQVVWESVHSPLEPNPSPPAPGGGKRIFPDWESPTPPPTGVDESLVRVKARITPQLPNRTVYFQSYDVDDPSSDNPVIDDESKGTDNFGGSGILRPVGDTQTITDHALSDGSGWAAVDFYTTKRPGDNFRIAATGVVGKDFLNQIEAKQTDDDGSIVLKGGARPEISADYRTEMLTVWRKLWIEFDHMESPPSSPAEEFGTIEGISSSISSNSLSAEGDPDWKANCLEGGVLDPDGGSPPNTVDFSNSNKMLRTWEVFSNTSDTITVRTDYTGDGFDQPDDSDGDEIYEMENFTFPNTFGVNTDDEQWSTLLSTTGYTPANILSAIRPYYEGDGTPDKPCVYIRCEMLSSGNDHPMWAFTRKTDNAWPQTDQYGGSDFWTLTVGLAYEHLQGKNKADPPGSGCTPDFYVGDDDPEDEGVDSGYMVALYGIAHGISGDECLIFLEILRDRPLLTAGHVVAHEVGHLLGLSHASYSGTLNDPDRDGMMGWQKPASISCMKTWMDMVWGHTSPDRFSWENVAHLRKTTSD